MVLPLSSRISMRPFLTGFASGRGRALLPELRRARVRRQLSCLRPALKKSVQKSVAVRTFGRVGCGRAEL